MRCASPSTIAVLPTPPFRRAPHCSSLPQQDIHDAGDLGVATPHRLEIAAARLRRDIDADALQHVAGIEESFEGVPHLSVALRKCPYQAMIASPNTNATTAPTARNTPNGTSRFFLIDSG